MKIFNKLIACLSLVLITQGALAQDAKIGVIDAMEALFNSDAAQIVRVELEQEFAVDQARAAELNEQMATIAENFQQNEAVMSDEEKSRAQSDAQEVQVQLQLISERLQQASQAKNQEFVESMQDRLAAAVTDVVAEGGYDMIINANSVPYFAPVLGITAKVTAKLNESTQRDE